MTPSLYQRLVAAGATLENHASDLYVKIEACSRPIVLDYCRTQGLLPAKLVFTDAHGACWYDIPFQYEPFWKEHA